MAHKSFKNIEALVNGNTGRQNEIGNQFFVMTCKYLLSHQSFWGVGGAKTILKHYGRILSSFNNKNK